MKRVGIIGVGTMGESIVRALLGSGIKKTDIFSFEVKPARVRMLAAQYGIKAAKNAEDLVKRSDYIVIAVKPQDAKAALAAAAPAVTDAKIVISIMAGITTSSIISMLEKPAKVVRVMPNIAVAVGEGALGIAANYLLSEEELAAVQALLEPLGSVVQVGEEQMDALTALSGSGPAFFLAFLEGMIDGGVKMGLPRDKATELAVQTVKGTVTLLQKEKMHPAVMREMVTSPGGTTIAGLAVLEEKAFKGSVIRALEAAQARSKELSR